MCKKYRYRLTMTTIAAISFFFIFGLTKTNTPQQFAQLHDYHASTQLTT
jgi:hypothetical protein